MLPQSAIEKIKLKKIYALEGNIGAGKTTILKIIAKHFKDIEFVEEPVNKWQNLGGMNLLDSFYSNPQRWGFAFEFYTMLTKIEALLKVADSDKPIIIVERSILSDKTFIDISKELGKLDKMEYTIWKNTYKFYLQHVYPHLSGIIYLDTPIEECIKRITKRKRKKEGAIDESYLKTLKTKMDELINSSSINIIKVDGLYDCEKDECRICDDILGFYIQAKNFR